MLPPRARKPLLLAGQQRQWAAYQAHLPFDLPLNPRSTVPSAMTDSDLDSPLAALVRRYDHDRYLTTLFAPAAARPALFAIAAFNHELAKTREVVSEAMLGEIRLQWWSDAVGECFAGSPRRHEVVTPLAEAIQRFGLDRAPFDRMIEARRFDLGDSAPPDLNALESYCADTAGAVVMLGLQVLGVEDPDSHEAARHVGIAYGLTGLLRAVPFHAQDRRVYLPTQVVEAVAADMGGLFDLKPHEGLERAVAALASTAANHLRLARRIKGLSKSARTGLLVGRLAQTYLGALRRAGHNVFDARVQTPPPWRQLTLTAAALTGRF